MSSQAFDFGNGMIVDDNRFREILRHYGRLESVPDAPTARMFAIVALYITLNREDQGYLNDWYLSGANTPPPDLPSLPEYDLGPLIFGRSDTRVQYHLRRYRQAEHRHNPGYVRRHYGIRARVDFNYADVARNGGRARHRARRRRRGLALPAYFQRRQSELNRSEEAEPEVSEEEPANNENSGSGTA
jgi:hypothetical protein